MLIFFQHNLPISYFSRFLSFGYRPFSYLTIGFGFAQFDTNLSLRPSLSRRTIFAMVVQHFSSHLKVSIWALILEIRERNSLEKCW